MCSNLTARFQCLADFEAVAREQYRTKCTNMLTPERATKSRSAITRRHLTASN